MDIMGRLVSSHAHHRHASVARQVTQGTSWGPRTARIAGQCLAMMPARGWVIQASKTVVMQASNMHKTLLAQPEMRKAGSMGGLGSRTRRTSVGRGKTRGGGVASWMRQDARAPCSSAQPHSVSSTLLTNIGGEIQRSPSAPQVESREMSQAEGRPNCSGASVGQDVGRTHMVTT